MMQVGFDEAGRGPWAGPVYAAVVVLPDQDDQYDLPGLDDSKRLTAQQRLILAAKIKTQASDYGIAFATVDEIDTLNIFNATLLAMQRAYHALNDPSCVQHALVDGLHCPDLPCASQAVVQGDQRYPAISAASILAKVTRDQIMLELDAAYPGYGFKQHKGYGTCLHRDRLKQLGPCAVHRRSFKPVKHWLSL